MDFRSRPHLITKRTVMKKSEILKANLLDIVFENRNKEYGAYTLRKGYNNRLFIALGMGLVIILLFIFTASMNRKISTTAPIRINQQEIVLRSIELPKEKIIEIVKPKEIIKRQPVVKVAVVSYTTPPKIEKDKDVKNAMVAVKELDGKEISTITSDGIEADGKVVINNEAIEPGISTSTTAGPSQPIFLADERDPAFPGGQEALKQFLSRNLNTPGELDEGERKLVQIKFKVDKDGTVNSFEIMSSGGGEFDLEVLRVCKKMPRWIPAVQNGINVPVSYVLPVTFIGS